MIIDGLDGAGKSTQAILLASFLEKKGKTVCLRVHPSEDNFFGIESKRFLYSKGKSAHFAAALFYMLDVVHSIAFFHWRKYDYTIFVRYLMGTAYLPEPFYKIAYYFFALVVPRSDNMFFLDVTPEEAYSRIQKNRVSQEMFEDLKALRKVRYRALSLTYLSKWRILNANKSQEHVNQEIQDHIKQIDIR